MLRTLRPLRLILFLLLRGLRIRAGYTLRRFTPTAASSSPAAPAAGPLPFGAERLLLGRPLLLAPVLLLLRSRRLPLILVAPGALLLPPLSSLCRALAVVARLAGSLLPFAELLLHETPCLGVLLMRDLAEPAVRAAPPSLGIGLLAGRAENALRQRHGDLRSGHKCLRPLHPGHARIRARAAQAAHCTLPAWTMRLDAGHRWRWLRSRSGTARATAGTTGAPGICSALDRHPGTARARDGCANER